jgi:dihydroorotate dehydrogenase
MYPFFRRYLFMLEAERAHWLALRALGLAGSLRPARWMLSLLYATRSKPVSAFGLTFKNPVGLAAGYDKDAAAVRGLAALGFGHIEVGTVTPLPQPGNPRPRVFRLIEDQAIVDRTGYPSRGSAYVQRRMNPGPKGSWMMDMIGAAPQRKPGWDAHALRRTAGCIIGVNIGKNQNTPNEQAVLDYLELLQNFAPYADYLTINVGSPNTPGLREMQAPRGLEQLLTQLNAQRHLEQEHIKRRLPLLVKLGPDLMDAELADAVDVILRTHMDGIIVTNTTLARDGLRSSGAHEDGGLGGSPLRERSEAALKRVLERVAAEVPVVSAGGISGPDDVKRRLDMGAALVQIYSGLVYQGPGIVKQTLRALNRE